ncbi:MAG: J domain-containing protein [Bacteroidales bacterium]|nr:J domain-containing protein [Bacteroidales bacterium]
MKSNYITYYQLLEIEPTASTEEILKAYKEKAKEYHPDKNGGHHTATKLFQYIQDAKETLIDSQKRIEYDYMAGIKKRPDPAPRIIKTPVKESNNLGTLLAVGAVGLLVGLFIGNSKKKQITLVESSNHI